MAGSEATGHHPTHWSQKSKWPDPWSHFLLSFVSTLAPVETLLLRCASCPTTVPGPAIRYPGAQKTPASGPWHWRVQDEQGRWDGQCVEPLGWQRGWARADASSQGSPGTDSRKASPQRVHTELCVAEALRCPSGPQLPLLAKVGMTACNQNEFRSWLSASVGPWTECPAPTSQLRSSSSPQDFKFRNCC